LNPRQTVGKIVSAPMEVNGIEPPGGREARVRELLETVGLNPEHYNRFPHEFSGGQRQRIGVARALALEPKLIVADEPVSALDVSIQAQVVNLLQKLQKELGIAFLFIAHDLAVVRHFSQRVAVMYLGRIVEIADRDDLYGNPRHPYTRALLSA
ncbi:ATP-binding cassette domain-containing protein, partial [Streptomyces sp. DT225]